jgi:hypothetical protein
LLLEVGHPCQDFILIFARGREALFFCHSIPVRGFRHAGHEFLAWYPHKLSSVALSIDVSQFRDKQNLPHLSIATAMQDFFSEIFEFMRGHFLKRVQSRRDESLPSLAPTR